MAAAPFVTDVPIERPSKNGSHFDEPFIEPFLAKHSKWYRRHFKVEPATEAAPVTEAAVATEGLSQTRNSSVTPEPSESDTAPAAAKPEQGVKDAEPVGKEENKARRSSVVKALRWAFWYNGNK